MVHLSTSALYTLVLSSGWAKPTPTLLAARQDATPTILPLPNLIVCQPATIEWAGGIRPYILWAMPNWTVSSDTDQTESFRDIYAEFYLWTPDFTSEQAWGVNFKVTDGTWTDSAVVHGMVQSSDSSACLNSGGYTSEVGGAAETGVGPGEASRVSTSPVSSTASQSSSSPSGAASSPDSSSGGNGQTDRGTIIAAVVGSVTAVAMGFIAWILRQWYKGRQKRAFRREVGHQNAMYQLNGWPGRSEAADSEEL